eukprot:TRINITY_DN11716_c0_g1_i1.p1 TRINITY_DN11716_c0_g1~~TRINITY_DN11716_c0_g1_i1.p1  ORF type:complete len:174 (+),score=28.88 TRINITY_DN11716_c0_g1_i1:73-594(+)
MSRVEKLLRRVGGFIPPPRRHERQAHEDVKSSVRRRGWAGLREVRRGGSIPAAEVWHELMQAVSMSERHRIFDMMEAEGVARTVKTYELCLEAVSRSPPHASRTMTVRRLLKALSAEGLKPSPAVVAAALPMAESEQEVLVWYRLSPHTTPFMRKALAERLAQLRGDSDTQPG